jgi:hypothetical protein
VLLSIILLLQGFAQSPIPMILVMTTLRDVVRRRTTRLLFASAPCHEL